MMCVDCGLPSFDSNAYQKIPLNRTAFSIRLIKLHPARTKEGDIVLELATNENGQLAYESISWCWGKGDLTSPIRVRFDDGDKCLKVSTNLESALRHLRLTDKFRVLWIDAICIDQSDSSEKSRQVPMMSEIYGKAKSVCVWLGDEDASTPTAISFMRDELLDLQHFDDLC
jgi:Heterokaryon incompatibility protein (HET)